MRDVKLPMHDLMQAGARDIPGFEHSLLVKWHVVCEFALADSHSLVSLSSDAAGRDLYRWESVGLLSTAIEQERRH